MKLSELIAAIGDEKVAFQNLDQCVTDINYSAKSGTRITFGTEQPMALDGPLKLGLVVWLDRQAVTAAVAADKAASA